MEDHPTSEFGIPTVDGAEYRLGLGTHFGADVGLGWEPPAVIGSPDDDAGFWTHQTTDFTCAVVSQQMILRQFGIDVSEAQLVYDATVNGWLTDGGTSPADVGQLLEHYGVPTHTSVAGGVDGLIDELSRGHKVVIGVDAGELWHQDLPFEDWLIGERADHAVVLTGLDMSDPQHPTVFINDPGVPDGAGKAYPLDQFLEAWADSGQFYVATDEAPPDLAAHPILGTHFDGAVGHYMDHSFWETWKESLRDRVGEVADRFVEGGTFVEANASAVIGATIDAWENMDDVERDSIFMSV